MASRVLAFTLALLLTAGRPVWAGPVARSSARVAPIQSGLGVSGAALPALSLPAGGLTPSLSALPAPALAPSPALAAPSGAPLASSQLDAAALPPPARPADDGAAAADASRRWDAASVREGVAAVAAAPADAPAPSGLGAPGAAEPSGGRGVPAPRVALARAGQAAAWLGLTGLAALAHAPFDRLGLLVVSVVMGLGLGFMLAFFVSAAQQDSGWGWGPAPKDRAVSDAERDAARAEADALAREAGIQAPKRFRAVPYADINAQAGGTPSDSEVVVYGGVLDLPEGPRRAVLRHEMSHVKGNDSSWTGLSLAATALPASIALMAGAAGGDARALVALPVFVASLFLLGHSRKADEYHADQYAAHKDGTPAHMIGALRAIEAQERAFAPEPPRTRWRAAARRAGEAWKRVSRVWAAHPSHEKRIARLERLAR